MGRGVRVETDDKQDCSRAALRPRRPRRGQPAAAAQALHAAADGARSASAHINWRHRGPARRQGAP
eukprot:6212019-Pleurochrysis_carterae.AAC.3